jgi:triosephosphate isomerase
VYISHNKKRCNSIKTVTLHSFTSITIIIITLITTSTSTSTRRMRKIVIGGNWKCNGTKKKVVELVNILNKGGEFPSNCEVIIAPPLLHTGYVIDSIRKDIQVSVQNIWSEPTAGAWTGEITADLVKDYEINWTILGHSERRKYVHESSELVANKLSIALKAGLNVIACIGETLEEREAGKTMDIVISQLIPIVETMNKLKLEDWKRIVLAYEPVWAIGTGKTASPEQAQEVHGSLRMWLIEKVGKEIANELRIIYGGSVTAKNCNELISQGDIDGFLVGGASLTPDFLTIIASAKAKM